jgi:hypothetical protein
MRDYVKNSSIRFKKSLSDNNLLCLYVKVSHKR